MDKIRSEAIKKGIREARERGVALGRPKKKLTEAEFLKNYKNVVKLLNGKTATIREIAIECHVSKATVERVKKKLDQKKELNISNNAKIAV